MEALENDFEALKDDVFESVKTQPVDTFKVKLTSFKISDKKHHIECVKEMIADKSTVTEIWIELNCYLNFLNYGLLQHILNKFKNVELQQRMAIYTTRLKNFFRCTGICDFVKCWPIHGDAPPEKQLKKFIDVGSRKSWDTCTLEDLDSLKGRLATKLLLPSFIFILEKASSGSLTVSFSVPPSLVLQLQTDIRSTPLKEFVDMEIETITVDGVVVYEAPLLQYTTLLKRLYTSRSPLQPLPDSKPKPLLPFRLARIEKHSLSPWDMDMFTRENLRIDMDNVVYKKTAMELSELGVMGDGSRPQVILIEGAPGVGKTTFAWHQCRQWAEGSLLQAYSIVLLLPLRDNSSLSDFFRHSQRQVREEVSRRVAESGVAGCLIWLEAWDELSGHLRSDSLFTQLIQGIQLPSATIFITTRPWATGGLLGDRLSQHTELLALEKEEVESKIRAMKYSQTNFDSGFDFVQFIESNPMIRAAMYTPVSAAIVEQVFKSAPHNPPTTVTGLYSAYVLMRLEQHLSEHPDYSGSNIQVRTLADLPERLLGDLQRLCSLAYEGVSQQMIVFSSLPEGVSTLGLLETVPQIYDEGEDRVSYNFLHYTVQEYLAALHLSHLQPQQLMTIVRTIMKGMEAARFKATFQFLAGITKLEPFPVDFLSDLQWKDTATTCRLLYESQNQSLLTSVLGSGGRRLRLSHSATPTDYFASGYCLSHSNCIWNILSMSVNDVAMEFLSRGCNHQLPKTGISSQLFSASFVCESITAESVEHFLTIPYSLMQHVQHLSFFKKKNKLDERGFRLLREGLQRMQYLDIITIAGRLLVFSRHNRKLSVTRTSITESDFQSGLSSIGESEKSVKSIDSEYQKANSSKQPRLFSRHSLKLSVTSTSISDSDYESVLSSLGESEKSVKSIDTEYQKANSSKQPRLLQNPGAKHSQTEQGFEPPSPSTDDKVTPSSEIIGMGLYGEVLVVEHNSRKYAAKEYSRRFIDPEDLKETFTDKILRLRHANIVSLFGVCCIRGTDRWVVVMEIFPQSLEAVCEDERVELDPRRKLSILSQVAEGLAYLHNHQVIHGDLIPSNILLTEPDYTARISDYGNFLVRPACTERRHDHTHLGDYLPPEVYEGVITYKVDVFTFGHLSLYVVLRRKPHPLKKPAYKLNGKLVARTEVERREYFLEMRTQPIGVLKPLFEWTKMCLADEPEERPPIGKFSSYCYTSY